MIIRGSHALAAAASRTMAQSAAAAAQPSGPNDAPWLQPTSDFVGFDKYGSVALPAVAAQATILSFQVPKGRNGRVFALGFDFTANGGAVFTPNVLPVQLSFSIQTDAQGASFADYGTFSFLPGSVILPVEIAGLMLFDSQQITVLVTNNTIVKTTQFVAARLLGYYYPKKRQPADAGFQ